MPKPNAKELPELLQSRKDSFKVLDQWDAYRPMYHEWHQEILDVQNVYAGNWDLVWPDKVKTRALPKVPNYIQIAADDRSRQVAATKPSLLCRPDRAGDTAKTQAEKRERIIGGWWCMNRLHTNIPRWAMDAMGAGITACRVLPDFNRPKDERFPIYTRLDPALCYPDPVFTAGPWVDSMMYSYEDNSRTIAKRFGVALNDEIKRTVQTDRDRIRVIEYYDDEYVVIILETTAQGGRRAYQTVVSVEHELEKCPVVIGARPTLDGVYRGEFFGTMGVMNFWNKMMTMSLDDAMQKVYSGKLYYDIENPEDYGPDALLEAQSPQARFEHIQAPAAPFTNVQFLRDLGGFARAGVLMPPSRSGDPNESIISAAGISATQSQFVEDVKSIQRDILAPMLEAANEVAMRGDERWADVAKTVYGEGKGAAYKETYTPTKDIKGCYRNNVFYGTGAGLDEINTNVMVLQQWAQGNGIISRRMAMEQSPFVEDPQRVEKELLKEGMEQAMVAGLQQQAAAGTITSAQLAEIDQLLSKDEVTLAQAIAQITPAPALAAPGPAAPGAPTQTPGAAGAQESQALPQNMPSLAELGVRRAG